VGDVPVNLAGELDVVDEGPVEVPHTASVLTDSKKLFGKMNRKVRICLRMASKSPDYQRVIGGDVKVHVIDLSSENVPVTPSVRALTYSELLQLGRSAGQVLHATNRLTALPVSVITG